VTVRAFRVTAACLGTLALAACASTPPEEDPVQIRLTDLDTRLARIERVMSNQSLLDLSNQSEATRNDVRAMHNDIDVLNHSLDALRKQQHDLYADLDARIKILEGRGTSGAPASAGLVSATPGGDGTDKGSYQAAFDLLKDSQFDRAIAAFKTFLLTYPASSLADNAQYWLGEAYYVNKSFPEAAGAFQKVIETYPQSRKLPDAMLKLGYCDYELKAFPAARDVLTQVAAKYPDAPAAALARQRLDKMAAEKH